MQGVYDFAAWLLQGTGGGPAGVWDKAALQAKIKQGARDDIKLTKEVPVIWVYLTGWAYGDGPANFRDDVYKSTRSARRRPAPKPRPPDRASGVSADAAGIAREFANEGRDLLGG